MKVPIFRRRINIANLVETDQNSLSLLHDNYSVPNLISFEMHVDEANEAQSSKLAFPVAIIQSQQDFPGADPSQQDFPVAAPSQQDFPVATQSPEEDIPVEAPQSKEDPTKENLPADCGVIDFSRGILSDTLVQIIPASELRLDTVEMVSLDEFDNIVAEIEGGKKRYFSSEDWI